MTDRVIVFTRDGIPLGEMDATVARSWQLQKQTRAERAVLQVRASTVNRNMTKFRNIVVVLSNKVASWCGVIWDARDWADNRITATLYAYEYALSFRRTRAVEEYDDAPHTIYQGLLKTAQKDENLRVAISSAYISGGGTSTAKEYNRENIFQAVNDLSSESEYYWWFEPVLSTANRLTLRAWWKKQRGIVYPRPLVQGSNFIDVKVTEVCQVANRIFAEGEFEDWHEPLEYIAQDAASRSEFGLVEDVVSDHDITDQAALVAFGKSELTKRKQPRTKITGRVTSTPYPKIGDLVTVQLSADNLGYSGGGGVAAKILNVRIKSLAYSPEQGESVTITADNIYWD